MAGSMLASVRPPVMLMAAALTLFLKQGSTCAAEQRLLPELNSILLVYGRIEVPWEAVKHLSDASTNGYQYNVKAGPACFQMQLRTNQDKAEQKQCVQLADSTTSVDYQLTLATSDPAGPGQLTVALEHTSFQSSTYFHLSGIATKLDMYLSKHQLLLTQHSLPASVLKLAAAQPESRPLLTVPSPLLHGAAIQLSAFLSGQVTDLPYYAISEELLEDIFLGASSKKVLPSQTPYEGSLPAKVGFRPADMLLCPESHCRSRGHHQPDGHRQLPETQASMLSAPLEQQRRTSFAWLPWGVSLCLLLCIVALLVNSRQQAAWQAAAQHDKSAAQIAADHEPSFVKSNWPGLYPTPTKDTGSSPFVPVTHFQAPVPHWPEDATHLASCSSKIGSYKQKARPATSKAVTNMTSNVSGATKWQRNKNGRLLSLALDPDEHNS